MELGSQIKRHRTRLSLSQEDLAQRLRDHDLVTYREIVAFTESGGAQKVAEPQGFSRRHPKLAVLAKLACGAVAGALVATVSLGVLRVLGA